MSKQPKEEKPKYITDENGTQFFVVGNTKIRVTEHFNSKGKHIKDLVENAVQLRGKLIISASCFTTKGGC